MWGEQIGLTCARCTTTHIGGTGCAGWKEHGCTASERFWIVCVADGNPSNVGERASHKRSIAIAKRSTWSVTQSLGSAHLIALNRILKLHMLPKQFTTA
jgi:hypothetical protein